MDLALHTGLVAACLEVPWEGVGLDKGRARRRVGPMARDSRTVVGADN